MENEIRYFRRERGGIVKLVNGVTVYSLDLNGEWVPNQDLISMFIDGMDDYVEINEAEVNLIIKERKNDEPVIRRMR